MAALTTKIGIVNRGLQILGMPQVNSVDSNDRGAKAMRSAYDQIFLAELRAHTWNFSIKRANLAVDPTAPIFGKTKAFQLPGDYLFLAPDETTFGMPQKRDYNIEGRFIITELDAPLPIRYVSSNITEGDFDPLFAEAFSTSLAEATCEELTNSNTKLLAVQTRYVKIINDAKKRNAIENAPVKAPLASTIAVRI